MLLPALLVPLLLLCAFGLLTWQIAGDGPLARADERLDAGLVHPDGVSGLLADLGNVQVAVPVLAVAAVYVAHRARGAGLPGWWRGPVAAVVLMAVLPALVVPLKDWIARPAPPLMAPDTGYFPSGHAATAAVAYGTAALLLLRRVRSRAGRAALAGGCVVLNAAVGLGLVRHGYHWPLDVAGSWCLCGVLLSGYALFLRRTDRPPHEYGP